MNVDKVLERRIQLKILDILVEIDRICKNNDIKYYLAYGTAIGAVRHKGFIPWDDDADIFMFKNEYEKFIDVCKTELGNDFFIQTSETDKEYMMSITKIRLNNTAFVENCTKDWNIHHGVYVDIFILDECPKNKFLQKINTRVRRGTELARRGTYTMSNKKNILKKLSIPLFYHNIILNMWKFIVYNHCKKDKDLCIDTCSCGGLILPRDAFGEPRNMEFEGYEFYVPENVEKFLTHFYGDFMTPPPEEQRRSHHDIVYIDLDNPYKKENIKK